MTQQQIPENLATLAATSLRIAYPARATKTVRAEARLALEPVLAYLRDRIARGPHEYECSLNVPPWIKDASGWPKDCDCMVKHYLYLLDHGVFEESIEEWIAIKSEGTDGS